MSVIELKHAIRKGDFSLDVDTTIPASGISGVFGASGSGKTTLLRCIAGLERSATGVYEPVHRRNIGYVFQQPSLFSHLSVRKNIEYGLRRNPNTAVSIDHVANLLDLQDLLARSPVDLSGGEAQRVSIARVLCQSPRLILMDEPLSALDERRRNDVLPYLDRLHADTAIPIIYVSHDIDEICRLCDHLLVLDNGRLVAEGGLHEILARIDVPQIGGRNAGTIIEATNGRYDAGFDLTSFEFSGGEIWVPGRHEVPNARIRIRANDVSLSRQHPGATTILNILPVTIDSIAPETQSTDLVRLTTGDHRLIARITRRSRQELQLNVGDDLYAQVKSVTLRSR